MNDVLPSVSDEQYKMRANLKQSDGTIMPTLPKSKPCVRNKVIESLADAYNSG